jgi:hypothetical protein
MKVQTLAALLTLATAQQNRGERFKTSGGTRRSSASARSSGCRISG